MEPITLNEIQFDSQILKKLVLDLESEFPDIKFNKKNALDFIENELPSYKSKPFDFDSVALKAMERVLPAENVPQEIYEGFYDTSSEYIKGIIEKVKLFLIEWCDGKYQITDMLAKGILHALAVNIYHHLNIPAPIAVILLCLLIDFGYHKSKKSLCETISYFK